MQGELVDKGRLIALLPTNKLAKMVEVCFRWDIPLKEVKRSGSGLSQNKRVLKNITDQIDGMDPDQVRGKILKDFRLTKWPGDETTADEMLARYRGSIEWNPHRSLAHVSFLRISVKAHSLNGGCRTLFRGERLTEKFYLKCATSSAAI